MISKENRKHASGAAAVALAAAITLAGCASTGGQIAADDENDPLEVPNRLMFSVNDAFDSLVVKPLAYVYRESLPDPVQTSVRSLLNYLRTPVILANDVLQGEWDRAGVTLQRFVQNTMVVGLWDVAAEDGKPFHDEDFGQTLGVWGVGEGFYLVLPVFGPGSPRDAVGLIADHFLDPLDLYLGNTHREWLQFTRMGIDGVDTRARYLKPLDEIEKTSLDYYATFRSLYRQKRIDEIENGQGTSNKMIPGLTLNDDDAPIKTQTSLNDQ